MRRETKLKPMNADLDTAKLLVELFGHKVLDDLNLQITIKGGDKEDDGRK